MWLNSYSHFFKATIACTSLLLSPVVLPTLHAQEQNVVIINPTDSPAEIVRKAANVVPSARQFNWQRQELTAFLHYGINTILVESGVMVRSHQLSLILLTLMLISGYVS